MPSQTDSYNLGFTAYGLGEAHACALAKLYLELGDWKKTKDQALDENVFRQAKGASSSRQEREFRLRLQTLTDDQLELMVEDPAVGRIPMALLAVFKRYRFIRDFSELVLDEKRKLLDFEIRPSDYSSFVEQREPMHPELLELSDTTAKKLKQVTFRILTEGGILTSGDALRISPGILPPEVISVIEADNPNLLRPFLQP